MFKKLICTFIAVSFVFIAVVSFAEERNPDRKSSEKLIVDIKFSPLLLLASPDNKRFAYMAENEKKRFVVVDGGKGKNYDAIAGALLFSPDSKYLAYVAQSDNKQFVVVGAKEEKFYDNIIIPTMGRIVFDASDRFHYLAVMNKGVYLVDVKIGGN